MLQFVLHNEQQINQGPSMTNYLLTPLFEDFDTRAAVARRHAVAGHLSSEDLNGIYRRVASNNGCTPEDAKRWIEGRNNG